MTQKEKREYLIGELIGEFPQYADIRIPEDEEGQKHLLRSLMNVRPPRPVSDTFLEVQDAYLGGGSRETGRDRWHGSAGDDAGQPDRAVAGGYHHAQSGRHCQRGQQCSAGLFCTLPFLY